MPADHIIHGVLMTAGWGLLLPLGVIIARFFRQKEPTTGPNAWWFVRHQWLQYTGLACTLAGFAVAIYMKWNTHHFDSTHAKCGLAVMIVGVMQPLNAFIRPKPGAPYRAIWSFCHKNLGYGAVLLAIVTIVLGLRIAKAPNAYVIAYIVLASMLVGYYIANWLLIYSASFDRSVSKETRQERVSLLRNLSTDNDKAALIVTINDDMTEEEYPYAGRSVSNDRSKF